ncbi:MAG: response regulator [Chloroflexi bacterium]|nr:response regulator [Chloroflexota bacterium]
MRPRPVIFLIEDDPLQGELVRRLLEPNGYTVLPLVDGWEALEAVSKIRPTLVLWDLLTPGLNGMEFARAYRALPGEHAPIVVLGDLPDRERSAWSCDAVACLVKPYSDDELLETVKKHTPLSSYSVIERN